MFRLWHSLRLSDEGCAMMRRVLEFKCKALCVIDDGFSSGGTEGGCSLVPAALVSDHPAVQVSGVQSLPDLGHVQLGLRYRSVWRGSIALCCAMHTRCHPCIRYVRVPK